MVDSTLFPLGGMLACMDDHKQLIYQAISFSLVREAVRLPDGAETVWSVVRHPGAACVLPLDGDDVILCRNYRPHLGMWLLELPGGALEADESPLEAARRELREEAGFTAKAIIPLGAFRSVQGFSDFILYYHLAAGLTPTAQHLDEFERVEAVRVPFVEVVSMLRRGELEDSQIPVCLLMAMQRGALPARCLAMLLAGVGDGAA